jgi:ADP-ribose pyrophosphatase YjhB (NUDIX family)
MSPAGEAAEARAQNSAAARSNVKVIVAQYTEAAAMDPDSYIAQLRALVGPRLLVLPSVRAIVADREGRVLLQKRRDFGNWGLPGGMPEPGESIEQAIVRETLEETGLRIAGLRPVGFASDPVTEAVTYPNGHQVHSFSLILHATEWSGELRPTDPETVALQFFDPASLPDMQTCQRRTVEKFVEYQRTGEFQLY